MSFLINFVRRHKRKLLWGGIFASSGYVLYRYIKKKLLNFQEKEVLDLVNQSRKWHHFENNQRTCYSTVISLVPTLRGNLVHLINTEELTALLHSKPKNKIEIWEELKLASFSRTICCVYSMTCLVIFVRIQLNIIGGYLFVDSTQHSPDQIETEAGFASSSVQRQYLEAVKYLLDSGLRELKEVVYREVEKLLQPLSLKEPVSLLKIQSIVNHVRQELECHLTNGSPRISQIVQFMLNPEISGPKAQVNGVNAVDTKVQQLLTETRDLLECPDFDGVLTGCLDTAFNRLMDRLAQYFKPVMIDGHLQNPNDVTLPLAKVVPLVNNIIFSLCNDNPNRFVQELFWKDSLKDFSANIYEAFSQPSS